MTKEEIYNNYLKDPLLFEKRILSNEKAERLRFSDPTEIKLLEILKMAINGSIDQESEALISRKINTYLNAR